MRINFLAVITGIFVCCFIAVSCLDSNNNNYEYSSDAIIREFALDSIYKDTYYTFTIDQINGLIYNEDSIPVHADTIINKILVKTISTSGFVTAGDKDTLFNMNDSVDLTQPLHLKITAMDGVHTKKYEIRVNRHTQDPDSLVWSDGPITDSFSGATVTGEQKAVILNNMILVYPSPAICYRSDNLSGTASWNEKATWSQQNTQGLPSQADIYSIISFNNKLYATALGDVYTSVDGIIWDKDEALSGNVVTFLASFTTGLSGIMEENGNHVFRVTDRAGTEWLPGEGNAVPEDFPLSHISYAGSETANGIERVFLVGYSASTTTATVPWQSYDGNSWAKLDTPYDDNLPYMENPTIIYYNDTFYAYGDGFEKFYTSTTGISWGEEANEKFVFPEKFEGRSKYYSTVVDDKGYIWIIWSKTLKQNDEVWRGRLNRVGFEKK